MILGYIISSCQVISVASSIMYGLSDLFFKSSVADMPSLEQNSFPDHGVFPLKPRVASFIFGLPYLWDQSQANRNSL